MKIRTSVLLGLFAGGVILLALGVFTGPSKKMSSLNEVRVVKLSGKVSVTSLDGKSESIESESKAVGSVTVNTDVSGNARVIFSESEVSVSPNSWIEFNTLNQEIIVKRGDIEVIRAGPEKKWTVTRFSKRYWLENYTYNRVVEDHEERRSQPTVGSNEAQKLMIQNSIARQRGAFLKCYSQKLRRDPQTTQVQALVSITVQPSGVISKSKIISLTPQDTSFENCLLQVMERIQLPSFVGRAIETSIPFEFE